MKAKFPMTLIRGAVWAAVCCAAVPAMAEDEASPDRARERIEESVPDARAQSGATAADEARIYTAELKRCEGLTETQQREACVETARKRLGQM